MEPRFRCSGAFVCRKSEGMKMQKNNSNETAVRSRRTVLKWTGGTVAMLAISGGMLPNFGITPALAADLGKGAARR